ncbi:hypothetical protein EJ04DRAFT_607487 [Polyplosphaeria fusca]|uniref:Uncharacterized protein n=1 Tax=Polyplosphaeria fusca TaxID=682080 RepID=A0A9P4UXY1_9PLEO|nr:hypothetical protein EJ04DRAFT_607487 [Polyplosphaeria fusca]
MPREYIPRFKWSKRLAALEAARATSKEPAPDTSTKYTNDDAQAYIMALNQWHKSNDDRIKTWLGIMPDIPSQFTEAFTEPDISVQLYRDWINWSLHACREFLSRLDKFEYNYRRTGLTYHSLPDSVLDRADSTARRTLAAIFKHNVPRRHQNAFSDVYTTLRHYKRIREDAAAAEKVEDLLEVREYYKRMEGRFAMLRASLVEIERLDRAITRLVEGTISKAKAEGVKWEPVDMSRRFSEAGGALRKWIWTLDEVQENLGEGIDEQIKMIVTDMLENGMVQKRWWSELTEQNEN